MKQIIVMVAMVALGVTIAGFVMGFGDAADTLAGRAIEEISYSNITNTPQP